MKPAIRKLRAAHGRAKNKSLFDRVLVTTRRAAELLSTTEGALNQWRFREQGPQWVRWGKRGVRYRLADILSYIESNLHQPADPGPLARAVNQ